MYQELLDPLSKIQHYELYINNTRVLKRYVDEFVQSIEVEFNYFRFSSIGILRCSEEFFTLSVSKNPSEFTNDDTIKIIFTDNANNTFNRRYNIVSAVKKDAEDDGEFWIISLIDIYGFTFNSPNYNKYITQQGYSGTPLQIVENVINDLIVFPLNEYRRYKDKKINIITKYNDIGLPDCPILNHRFVKDKIPSEMILNLCNEYNILLYQDYNNFYIIQNPNISELEKPEIIYRENTGTRNYYHKICDRIKKDRTVSVTDRPNYIIDINKGGKNHVTEKLPFYNLSKMIELNSNVVMNYRDDDYIYYTGVVNTVSRVICESYKKYIKANNYIIYVRPVLHFSNVGTITNIQSDYQSNFATRREESDSKTSGFYLISSSTLKIIKGHLIGRLILNRFDNPTDYTENGDVISDEEQIKPNDYKAKKSEYEEVEKLQQEIKEKLDKKAENTLDKARMKKEKILNAKRQSYNSN